MDAGAVRAVCQRHKSLFAAGIVKLKGNFISMVRPDQAYFSQMEKPNAICMSILLIESAAYNTIQFFWRNSAYTCESIEGHSVPSLSECLALMQDCVSLCDSEGNEFGRGLCNYPIKVISCVPVSFCT